MMRGSECLSGTSDQIFLGYKLVNIGLKRKSKVECDGHSGFSRTIGRCSNHMEITLSCLYNFLNRLLGVAQL